MTATVELGLAAALRTQTAAAHQRAENAHFVTDLLGGGLPISAYAALAVQNLAIYRALEDVAEDWRHDPVAGAFVLDELTRVAALEADVADLLGEAWPDRAEQLRTPATDRYVHRIYDVAADWPGAFVAHHYVRYLGDLSGGQVIRARVGQLFGEAGARATRFYQFDQIPKIKPFRDHYRELLDHALFTREQQRRVVAEAQIAFELNEAVFADLGGCYPAETRPPASPT